MRRQRDVAASVRQRLLNHARSSGEEFQGVLTRYTLERLLFRLSRSKFGKEFVLKGAVLFAVWVDQPHRATWDVDLLGHGEATTSRLEMVFREVCSETVEDDGLEFLVDSVRAFEIREGQRYGGIRVEIRALLGKARVPARVDVGFGDAITPGIEVVTLPTLLPLVGAPVLEAYPRETVLAEKLEAMVQLGMANSRMKDFYDLWVMSETFGFDGPTVRNAIEATFRRRSTALPQQSPLALTEVFSLDESKRRQWTAFVRRGRLTREDVGLAQVVRALAAFLLPPLRAATRGTAFELEWRPPGPWQPSK